ncbi:MAG: hypothetical protein ACJAY8_000767 [Sphingobacteriales bacterium]|jgi:hypothetical protein
MDTLAERNRLFLCTLKGKKEINLTKNTKKVGPFYYLSIAVLAVTWCVYLCARYWSYHIKSAYVVSYECF